MRPDGPTVDHIKSVKFFPELEFEQGNLQLMCRACNTSKHAGPQSRQARYIKPEPIQQRTFPGQTVWMEWLPRYNIWFFNGGIPWGLDARLVTFDGEGQIVRIEEGAG